MLELTGFGSVLRGISIVYWVIAIGAIALAIRNGRGKRSKAIWTTVVVGVFGYLPVTAMVEQHKRDSFAKEAWAYFKKLCDEKSGEKIYKTYTGVKSVLVVKALPPASERDLFDQFWYGDPYSNATPWDERAELAASVLSDPAGITSDGKVGQGFDFVETHLPKENAKYVKVFYLPGTRKSSIEPVSVTTSRFGISWEDISTPGDRKYWIAGSRLKILDLTDNSIVAERIGFLIEPGFGSTAGHRRPWLTGRGASSTCPTINDGHFEDRWFVLKALSPVQEIRNGK